MNGNAVLAGIDGREVGSFGFLRAPELTPWAATSDSASHYLGVVEANYASGEVLTLTGGLVSALGLVAASSWQDSNREWAGLGAALVGVGISIFGTSKKTRARSAMQSAIWWYNGDLVGSPSGAAPSVSSVVAAPQNRGLAGVVLGSAVGIAAGLAISSRHPATETAEGLTETLFGGAVGGFLGWRIGLSLPR